MPAGGITTIAAPEVTPAYFGVGYIIGPELGALNFAGGLLAWGLLVPLLVFFVGPTMIGQYTSPEGVQDWGQLTAHLYRYIARPIAVGGMLVGACFTLWRMRKNLVIGIKRGVADVRKSASATAPADRTQQDLSFKVVLLGIAVVAALMTALYFYFTHSPLAAVLAMLVMVVTGFFFAAVSGNLVGHDRVVQQPDFRPDAGHDDRRGVDDGAGGGARGGRAWRPCSASRPSAASRRRSRARCCRT